MRCLMSVEEPLQHACSLLVVGIHENGEQSALFKALDRKLGGALKRLREQREFMGGLNRIKLIHTFGKLPAERLLLVGLGKADELTPERLRQAAGSAMQAIKQAGVRVFSSALHQQPLKSALPCVVEGFLLARYTFFRYKTRKEENGGIEEGTFLVAANALERSESIVAETKQVCDAVCFARDLVAQPGNVATPAFLADRALEIAGKYGIKSRILERKEIEAEGMGAFLAVARGSHQPPSLILLEYSGAGVKKRPVALVGKGVTFDSGGISLKPRDGMEKMKTDMGGAAAVMGTFMAVAALRLPVNLVGIILAAENMPGGGACKPGDVVTSMSGQTIEITNTDAEGRMLLCDGLHLAQRYRPSVIIDVATLTGACVVALGHAASGLMGNDDTLKHDLRRAGEATGERLWELPLWDEYDDLIKSDIADMKNSAGPHAGTISAACFLKKFAGSSRWAHLDIAGTAWEERGRPYVPKGATGVGVRLLVEYLRSIK